MGIRSAGELSHLVQIALYNAGMQMFGNDRFQPESVFTPRADRVRSDMYITRPELERALRSALRMSKHVVVHGESGAGKSWLYKKVFAEDNVVYEVVNLGRAVSAAAVGSRCLR